MDKKTEIKIGLAIAPVLVMLLVPAFYMAEDKIFLGKWVIDLQISLFGCYFPGSTFIIILLIEFLILLLPFFITALLVKFLTGKTLIEIYHERKRAKLNN